MADPDADYWTITDVAEHWGVSPQTIRTYRSRGRGELPDPDKVFGRSPVWRPSTIINFQRPGQGARTDLPGKGGYRMSNAVPAPGTTRYLCPLECGWHHDDPPPSMEDVRGVAPGPDVHSFEEAVSSIASKAAMRRLERTEAALREHLATHTDTAEAAAIEQLLADAGLSGVNWRP